MAILKTMQTTTHRQNRRLLALLSAVLLARALWLVENSPLGWRDPSDWLKNRHLSAWALWLVKRSNARFVDFVIMATWLQIKDLLSVLNCGAIAPEWRFRDSVWRKKILGALWKKRQKALIKVKSDFLNYICLHHNSHFTFALFHWKSNLIFCWNI